MRSVSGLRGIVGRDLTADLVGRYCCAFGLFLRARGGARVALARDSRESGPAFARAAAEALSEAGLEVLDLGLAATPTAQMTVEALNLAGGVIVTASHNPIEWNALKFMGPGGRFLSKQEADELYTLVDRGAALDPGGAPGRVVPDTGAVKRHLDRLFSLPWLGVAEIRARKFTVALDCVRGAGATVMPELLERLGCRVHAIHLEPDGRFPREPEPLPEHLGELGELVRRTRADIGIAVDPDVDRCALVDETGEPIGEDYTLALAVRAVLSRQRGCVVANMSTSLVVEDAARDHGAVLERAPVGEANVVARMQEKGAVIGGEGNGGVILPEVHLGRDAPVAVALVLRLLTDRAAGVRDIVNSAPRYAIVKAKVERPAGPLEPWFEALRRAIPGAAVDVQDGLRLSFVDRWIHVRASGTEPVARIIAEAPTRPEAQELVERGHAALEEAGL
ncbi:MAG TPA: phosphoglucosamine mutase [Gemmatimonadales bacterium]|nr:phosphoglucosamine mutase [Gemmatimonadales bacterium]